MISLWLWKFFFNITNLNYLFTNNRWTLYSICRLLSLNFRISFYSLIQSSLLLINNINKRCFTYSSLLIFNCYLFFIVLQSNLFRGLLALIIKILALRKLPWMSLLLWCVFTLYLLFLNNIRLFYINFIV